MPRDTIGVDSLNREEQEFAPGAALDTSSGIPAFVAPDLVVAEPDEPGSSVVHSALQDAGALSNDKTRSAPIILDQTDESIAITDSAASMAGAMVQNQETIPAIYQIDSVATRDGSATLGAQWPLVTSLLILWATIAVLYMAALHQHPGYFIYALDDPYIHMAMAKNFAQHGVWGITSHEFSSSSSSPLWTFSIAVLFFLCGLHEIVPFVLCVLCASACLWALDTFLKRERIAPATRFGVLLVILFATPVPAMIFTGQEHLLHIIVTLLFVYYCINALAADKSEGDES
ncbi:MAG: hypothetical protein JOZ57_04300, partial [Abitibacteriaceae bacterium]|nr:hypothetical protein [Abditibacteriaceae bacterium]